MKTWSGAVILLILAAALCGSQTKDAKGRSIGEYQPIRLAVNADSATVNDTVTATVSMYLDCTNKVTRVDTVFDTLQTPHRVTIKVFGTIVNDPLHRPMCAARLTPLDVALLLPTSGEWLITTGDSLSHTVIVQ